MTARKNNIDWFYFHSKLMQYDFYINDILIPKYILFYKGYNADKMESNYYKNLKKEIKPS